MAMETRTFSQINGGTAVAYNPSTDSVLVTRLGGPTDGIVTGVAPTANPTFTGTVTTAGSAGTALVGMPALGSSSSAAGGTLTFQLQAAGTSSGNNSGGLGVFKAGAPNGSGAVSNWQFQSSGGTAYCTLQDSATGASTTSNFLNVTGIFPTTQTATTYGVYFDFTGAGSSNQGNQAFRVNFNAGYTGSNYCSAASFLNQNAGTGTTLIYSSASNPATNHGTLTVAIGATSGYNIGNLCLAENGVFNSAVWACSTVAKNSATNIGIAAFALNTGTTPIQCAGYFGLQNSTPTFVSAALICDNGGTSSPIFLGRANGTTQFALDSSGNQQIGNSATASVGVGTIVGKYPIYNTSGVLLGYMPIYGSIT